MKTYKQLKDNLMDYYGDTTRSRADTKRGLTSLIEECQTLIETINDEEHEEQDGDNETASDESEEE